MREILKNPATNVDQLRECMNKTHELNRLIAVHSSTDGDMLDEMIDFWGEDGNDKDLEICRLSVRHPNVHLNTLVRYGPAYPEDLLANPKFNDKFEENPDLFESIPQVLSMPSCPVNFLKSIALEGTLCQRIWMLMNSNLPEDIKCNLTSEKLNEYFNKELDMFTSKIKTKEIKQFLIAYKNTVRPFCLPNFLLFDRANEKHRKSDQILSGFPFTSSIWSWPLGNNKEYMQPITQINLSNAGSRLNENLGSGLLQVWGGVNTSEVMLRIIPVSDLESPMDNFYPENSPWLSVDMFGEAQMDDCMVAPFSFSDFRPFKFDRCRVEWLPLGNMYYPSLTKRVLFPLSVDEELSDFDQKLEKKLEKLDDKLDELDIPTGRKPGIVSLCQLGGYTDGLGNTWDRYSDPLLFYHSIDAGIKMTIGVTWKNKHDGSVEFLVDYTCDN